MCSISELLSLLAAIETRVKGGNKIDQSLLTPLDNAIMPSAFIPHISSYYQISNQYQQVQPRDCFETFESFPKRD